MGIERGGAPEVRQTVESNVADRVQVECADVTQIRLLPRLTTVGSHVCDDSNSRLRPDSRIQRPYSRTRNQMLCVRWIRGNQHFTMRKVRIGLANLNVGPDVHHITYPAWPTASREGRSENNCSNYVFHLARLTSKMKTGYCGSLG
jgi:hypothetical protein